MCVQDVQITCTANSKVKQLTMLRLHYYQSISLTKWPLGLKKDYRASSITTFILSMDWTASTGSNQGRGMPSFVPLALTGLLDPIRLLVHLWQWKECSNRLMVATQQVEEKMTWGLLNKEGLTQVWLTESSGYNLCQKVLRLTILLISLLLEMRHQTYHKVHCGSLT